MTSLRGDPMSRPLLMTGHMMLTGTKEWRVFTSALMEMLDHDNTVKFVTVGHIPKLIAAMRTPGFTRDNQDTRDTLIRLLQGLYDGVNRQIADGIPTFARTCSYQYNIAYGTPKQIEKGEALPLVCWQDTKTVREFIEHDEKMLDFPNT
ncbi:hypothetical protein GGF43_000944 [Coemansia sp. RSA 2618]|nr:hypothetical protein GGF43_000944 [Coemansia sp. RSA 2618]